MAEMTQIVSKNYGAKGPRFLEKEWYYLQAQTDMPQWVFRALK